MTRRAPRREQVSVAELLVRSASWQDALESPPSRHRRRSPVLRSLARVRVFSVVAGALAITGGVAAAVAQPYEHAAGAVWPPVGLEPVPLSVTPSPADAAKPPESVVPESKTGGIIPAAVVRPSNSGKPAANSAAPPKRVTPVRHEIPAVPAWAGGSDRHPARSASPHRQQAWSGGGHHDGGHDRHHRGGGGRHRR
ncbi:MULTISPECIES: hypothetical protein [unclassified Amycolatopsis]|uniref:hypothetical protein n=1 Tax=unclassified Amycolatopsis TaxID=2618356 RepID=UPI002E1E6C00|nr:MULTISPECIES: hypothetical protein [unclassified Amycolatopsis]